MRQRKRREQQGTLVIIGEKWCLRFWRFTNEDGVLMRRRATVPLGPVGSERKRPTKTITEAAEDYMRLENRRKIVPQRSGLTIGKFVEDVFLPLQDREKRPSTARACRQIWKRHLKPQIIQIEDQQNQLCADLLLSEAQPFHIQAWLQSVVDTSRRALSTSTLKHCKFFLSGLFRLAIQRGYRTKEQGHPVEDCCIPPGTIPQRLTHAYTADEVKTMLRVLNEPARTIIMLTAETGLRIGEVGALQWEDLNDSTLTVKRSVWNGKVTDAKTAASCAPVAIPWQLKEALDAHQKRDGSPKTGPMFRTALGSALSMNNVLGREILPILRRCAICHKPRGKAHLKQDPGMPEHEYTRDESLPIWKGWHCFRRALATDLQHAGAPVLVAQGALRHADANVTLRCYSKTVPEAVRSSVQQRADSLHATEFQDILRTLKPPSGAQSETVN